MDSRITAWASKAPRLLETRSGKVAVVLASFSLGIALAGFLSPPPLLIAVVLGGAFLFSFFFARHLQPPVVLALALLAVGLGVMRYNVALPDRGEGSVVARVGAEVMVEGVVVDLQSSSKTQGLVLGQLEVRGKYVTGRLLVRAPRYPTFRHGDRLRVSCTPEMPEPFEGFRYDRFLAKDNILALCRVYDEPFFLEHESVGWRELPLRLRSAILERIDFTFHEPYASLLAGVLLGEKRLPDTVEEDFRRVGLSHIVAASGQNVSLVSDALLILLTATFLRRRRASAVVLIGIGLYVLLAGADAAVVRAGIMGSLVVFARAVGRVPSVANLLLLALALMLLHNPFLLRDDVGFQLSFAATAGLVLLEPRIAGALRWIPAWGGLRQAMTTSLAAISATLPLTVFSFGDVSLLAPLANLFVIPLIPFLMLAGAVILLLSVLSQPLALVLSAPVAGGLELVTDLAHTLSAVPFSSLHVGDLTLVRLSLVVITLFLLRAITFLKPTQEDTRHDLSTRSFVVLALVLSLVVLPDLLPRRGFLAHFFSIGQGDSALLQLPDGERWIVDGGPDDTALSRLGPTLPWYSRRIDVLLPTHADADHVAGLVEVSRRYDIGRVVRSDKDQTRFTVEMEKYWGGVPIEEVRAGDILRCDEVCIRVLAPTEIEAHDEERNTRSVVLLVEYTGRTLLLTGDAPAEVERRLAPSLPHLDVLKAGHHGSYTSTSAELVKATTPSIAIISSGKENRYGHPHGIVLSRLKEAGATILRTDTDGDITIRLDELP